MLKTGIGVRKTWIPLLYFQHMRLIHLTILLIVVAPLMTTAQAAGKRLSVASLNFGSPPGVFRGLSLEIEEGPTSLYSLQEPVIFADDSLKEVQLTFTKNKLTGFRGVTAVTTRQTIKRELESCYGKLALTVSKQEEWKNARVRAVVEPLPSGRVMLIVEKTGN